VINCGAIAKTILESELFGHVRGAFTGADRERRGLLAAADGGSVFLDEIGELPLELQPALLRALQFGEIRPIGSNQSQRVDFRLISATNRDLEQQVKDGTFREDLFYRINTVTLDVPPLRDRPTDILPLFRRFLERDLPPGAAPRISNEARDTLLRYSWPGNVRELENEARRIAALWDNASQRVEASDFSPRILNRVAQSAPLTLDDAQRALVLDHLRYADGNRSRAAKTLGVSREGLRQMIERLQIDFPARTGRPPAED
jgi:transcriptional regulator with PAS, ATPase and Fis domain